MSDSDEKLRRLRTAPELPCPACGLPQEEARTPEHDLVRLEPALRVPAHVVPAERRWIELSDGRVTVYGVCPVDGAQQCRIEHVLVCPDQDLPDLWPWLTVVREETRRRAERRRATPELPEAG
ncbi:DUF6083 domain-containing protein [Streptomyces sp. NPDC059524]|uniref:DUF6083 domain-containing protein n=1 Tax=Streptomyces sp. NPDC059524 TaxID=3346856 RepID=UPI00368D0B21